MRTEVCGQRGERKAEEAVVGAVAGYEAAPKLELAGTGGEIGLESVEGREGCVAGRVEGAI